MIKKLLILLIPLWLQSCKKVECKWEYPVTISIPLENQSTLRTISVNFSRDGKIFLFDILNAVDLPAHTYEWTWDLMPYTTLLPGDKVDIELTISDRRDGSYYTSDQFFIVK